METWISLQQAREAIISGTGKGVRIAILDSGIEISHPGLNGLTLSDDLAFLSEGNTVQVHPGAGTDVNGHGTGIAGIIHTLAPKAEIGSFRVLRMGLFDLTSKRDIIQRAAFEAIDRQYQILNCSFGCRGEKDFIMEFKDWVDESYVKGVHVISACSNRDFTEREWPAYFPTVVTVDKMDIDQMDRFFYRPGNLVEFVAKGQYSELLCLDGKKKNGFGTSFAAPVATALLARLISVYPGLSPLAAKELLRLVAEPWSKTPKGRSERSRRSEVPP
ncbi:MAG: S8 family serine peptidase [Verrucomicrobia bacterium]|nr:S8 family serine peptidase [Verrucomicrobiota bacterium]